MSYKNHPHLYIYIQTVRRMKLSNTVGRWENPIKNGHMYIYIYGKLSRLLSTYPSCADPEALQFQY
jgi:hypothetical protein